MKKTIGMWFSAFLAAMMVSVHSHAYPGESIVRNSAGDYVITYWNTDLEPPGLETTTFITSTKIEPTIQSRFSIDRGGNSISYRYTVSSGLQSKQTLIDIIFGPVDSIIGTRDDSKMGMATAAESAASMAVLRANKAALATPSGWNGFVTFGNGESTNNSLSIGWGASVERSTGLKPGNSVRGFGFSSYALPDIVMAEFRGDAPVHGWSGEGPDETSAIYAQIEQVRQNDFVPRNVAVPAIAVPSPFDAAVLLDRIRAHVSTWPSKQLLDPAFAAQLDRYMVAAADAYRLNNAKAGKEHIKKIRELLEHEHKHLDHDDEDHEDTDEHKTATRFTIDRLAARVLDFDLRYVLKRTEHEHEEGDHRKER